MISFDVALESEYSFEALRSLLKLEGRTPILSNLFHSSPLENHGPERAELVPDTMLRLCQEWS